MTAYDGLAHQIQLLYNGGSQIWKFQGLPLTLAVCKWNQMDPLLVPFVHCQSYRLVWVDLDPPKGTQRVPEKSTLRNPALQAHDVPRCGLVDRPCSPQEHRRTAPYASGLKLPPRAPLTVGDRSFMSILPTELFKGIFFQKNLVSVDFFFFFVLFDLLKGRCFFL